MGRVTAQQETKKLSKRLSEKAEALLKSSTAGPRGEPCRAQREEEEEEHGPVLIPGRAERIGFPFYLESCGTNQGNFVAPGTVVSHKQRCTALGRPPRHLETLPADNDAAC